MRTPTASIVLATWLCLATSASGQAATLDLHDTAPDGEGTTLSSPDADAFSVATATAPFRAVDPDIAKVLPKPSAFQGFSAPFRLDATSGRRIAIDLGIIGRSGHLAGVLTTGGRFDSSFNWLDTMMTRGSYRPGHRSTFHALASYHQGGSSSGGWLHAPSPYSGGGSWSSATGNRQNGQYLIPTSGERRRPSSYTDDEADLPIEYQPEGTVGTLLEFVRVVNSMLRGTFSVFGSVDPTLGPGDPVIASASPR